MRPDVAGAARILYFRPRNLLISDRAWQIARGSLIPTMAEPRTPAYPPTRRCRMCRVHRVGSPLRYRPGQQKVGKANETVRRR
jgi:hypothetical protein